MWRRVFRDFFCLPPRVDTTDEGAVVAEAAQVYDTEPARVQRGDDCAPPPIQVGLPVDCHQQVRVLNSVEAAAACRAAAGDMSICVIESQSQVEAREFAGSDKTNVWSAGHDYSAKVLHTSAGNVDFEKVAFGLTAGYVDSMRTDDGSMVSTDHCAIEGDARHMDVATPTEDHRIREVELPFAAAERSTANLDSTAAFFSGSGSVEGKGDADDGRLLLLQRTSTVQKTVKWAAKLTDSVPVSWLRLRAELEQSEQEELNENDSVSSSHLLQRCILLVRSRSFHKNRPRTSVRWAKDVQDHMEQEDRGSGSTDAEITDRKARGFSAFHLFSWAKNTN